MLKILFAGIVRKLLFRYLSYVCKADLHWSRRQENICNMYTKDSYNAFRHNVTDVVNFNSHLDEVAVLIRESEGLAIFVDEGVDPESNSEAQGLKERQEMNKQNTH